MHNELAGLTAAPSQDVGIDTNSRALAQRRLLMRGQLHAGASLSVQARLWWHQDSLYSPTFDPSGAREHRRTATNSDCGKAGLTSAADCVLSTQSMILQPAQSRLTLSMREKKESRPPPPPPLTSGASSPSSSSSAARDAPPPADGPCGRGGAYAGGPPVLSIVLPCRR